MKIKSLGVNKNNYGDAGMFCACFMAPKLKYCLVFNNYRVISSKRSFRGYIFEHRMIKLNDFISLSGKKTVSGRFSTDWTKTFEGIKLPHRNQDCLDCNNEIFLSDCVTKANINGFNCEVESACKYG